MPSRTLALYVRNALKIAGRAGTCTPRLGRNVRLARLLPIRRATLREATMLWTIVIILLVLWLLGFLSGSVGGLIHILLVIAIIVVLIRVIQGRRPV